MRGVLLLTVATILIWLGVRSSGTEGPGAAPPSEAVDLEDRGGIAPVGSDANRDEDPVDEQGVVREEERPEPATPTRAAEAEIEEPEPVAEAVVVDEVPDPPPASSTPEPIDDGPIEFGTGYSDPVELAGLLVHGLLRGDPAELEAFLNEGAGAGMPRARKQLVLAFWRAMTGDREGAAEVRDALAGVEGVTSAQLALLTVAIEEEPVRAVPASDNRRDPIALAMRVVLLDDRARRAKRGGDLAAAARAWSDALQVELEAPWPADHAATLAWAQELGDVQRHHRLHPEGSWPSIAYEVQPGDNLYDIRKELLRQHPGLRICVGLLREVNDVGDVIHPGDLLRVPTESPNVVVYLDARLALYRHGSEVVHAWKVGIGKEGQETPTGQFEVGDKQENPAWTPLGRAGVPYGHPENPLGTRWIAWFQRGQKTSYGFHGTRDPGGVGQRVSRGCVRMTNADVELLYELLPVGSRVHIRP